MNTNNIKTFIPWLLLKPNFGQMLQLECFRCESLI